MASELRTLGPKGANFLTDPQTGSTGSWVESFKQQLEDPGFSIPIQANFTVGIEIPQAIINRIDNPSIRSNINVTGVLGGSNIYAQSVSLPGENIGYERLSVSNTELAGSLLPVYISKNRKPQTIIDISFLETTSSFIDVVVRPWLLASSGIGLYRPVGLAKKGIYESNIDILQFDRARKIRKHFTIKNAVPLSVESVKLAYDTNSSTAVKIINTTWLYSDYSISYT